MNEQEARKILGPKLCPNPEYVEFTELHYNGYCTSTNEIVLDGEFTAQQIEALAWWMANKPTVTEQL